MVDLIREGKEKQTKVGSHHTPTFFFQYSGSVLERRGPTWRGEERDWDSGIYQGLDGKRARRVNEGVRGQALDDVAAMGQSHLWDGPDASRRVWRAGRNVLLLARAARAASLDAVPCNPGRGGGGCHLGGLERATAFGWQGPLALWCSGAVLTLQWPRCVTLEPREMMALRDQGWSIPCSTPTWIKGPRRQDPNGHHDKKREEKEKKVDLRLTAPTAVLQGSPPGRGVFRMSLRASQVGKPRRQLSTSGPESDIAAGALTLLFTQPTKQCNPQTKPAWGPVFHRPSGSFPASTDPPSPGAPEQNRHRKPWSVWIQGPEERFWIPCPDERRQGVPWPSALLALWRPSKHFVALKIVNKGSGANNKTTQHPHLTKG